MNDQRTQNNADEGRSELSGVLGGGITPKQAMDALRKAMQEDYGYAWSWHCNVAMAAVDAGAPHKEANERAAGFMRNAFGVDTRLPPNVRGNTRMTSEARNESELTDLLCSVIKFRRGLGEYDLSHLTGQERWNANDDKWHELENAIETALHDRGIKVT